ncbi:indoleamine 23-dioxygenase family protein [Pyrenophora tritici-repentis]|uniref:Indoleamine 2,3-dioxygenase n=2 Tax=Pyrenophora tritici-repentis TaxID=45151 RepID=A0A2W1GT50_9PLEO|nr:indoleamine 2,3-dioxygenase family protein [Pyrenophora tritici-repentis Pt-1C-BFP]KAA8621766.1 Indoleamine 2 3-dioxygenase family protein [Pyrenophora tritici-repentis]EDU42910.1 indoleamine 2,3-dioxygenase family protein [Pyrenophora tritici-repentis Pt-1C-BFP]KAF7450988.1 Indoleamine 2-3-dioxygenase family protein [Pyrenophora tritici-repentis]KAF7573668.1 indoleamine 2,3-dioxygenase family protein [Pyrenophora tritici-repentis]KAG9380798.1 Indoleamine 2,3-dioxygenase family protein [Pyr
MLPTLPQLSDYDVSAKNGFLPDEVPLDILPDRYYQPWETIVSNFQNLILAKRLRRMVDTLPVLDTDLLLTEAEWRRAYSILGFIAHAYIWGGDRPADIVPPSISIPFLETCKHLELPPVATFAAVCLWNWRPLFQGEPTDTLGNLATQMTFTGSMDESWFYLVSVAIEARAGPVIPMMIEAIAAARRNDSNMVVQCLRSFAERLDEIGTLLERMYESCDPHVFYHRIRPFLAGSKNMADAGLPNGVMFDDGTGQQPYVQFSGGSNAQSSIIQFFDVVLGVEHRPTGEKRTDVENPALSGPSHGFIQDMRNYMPGPHRRFLEHMESIANIREYVTSNRNNRALTTAYDACLAMLRTLRDKHIQLVSRYIIIKSRETRSNSSSLSSKQASTQRVNLANTMARSGSKKLRGTGGTALIPFLKQARDETGEPAIDAWAKRLLNNGPAEFGAFLGVDDGVARPGKVSAGFNGGVEIVGLAGTWSVDDSEGGICHW